jgi:hypothetical protein
MSSAFHAFGTSWGGIFVSANGSLHGHTLIVVSTLIYYGRMRCYIVDLGSYDFNQF